MQTVGKFALLGMVAAVVGVVFTALFSEFFNGLSQVAGFIIGMGVYGCFMMVLCTGIIVAYIDAKK